MYFQYIMTSSIIEQLSARVMKDLAELLEPIHGRKRIYVEPSIFRVLQTIPPAIIAEHEIENSVRLEDVNFDSIAAGGDFPDVLVFIVRAEPAVMKTVATQVRTGLSMGDRKQRKFHVFFAPQRSILAEQALEVISNNYNHIFYIFFYS